MGLPHGRATKLRQANLKLALVLASIAAVFFIGFIAKSALFSG
ncbi:MAG: cytochrome oxidase small assembly protein [Pseudomonadota bacterium]|nr:cytochrome oxidase small assembly protein [Pseudomonadota bacterium]